MVVGPTRFRSIHTKTQPCLISLDGSSNQCNLIDYSETDCITDPINNIPFQSCEKTGISHSIEGETGTFRCFGHVLDVY